MSLRITTTAKIMLCNMAQQAVISESAANLVHSAVSERTYAAIPKEYRDTLRASVFKNMLLTLI